MLKAPESIDHWKASGLKLDNILHRPKNVPAHVGGATASQDHHLRNTLDHKLLLRLCEPALHRKEPVRASLPIRNTDRTVGTMLGSEVTRRYGSRGLDDDTIRLHFEGSAGQSFGAFLPRGITLILEGDANDYVGKGLSGGRLIIFPPQASTFASHENIIMGNTSLYGATSGEAFVSGVAGERFAVRNSGARAVVEAVGDHGCEYMTGGRVVVLGSTGRNFAAGMSGGIAWVLDWNSDFVTRCNTESVALQALSDPDEIAEVKGMVRKHAILTGSELARRVLTEWDELLPQFVRVMPSEYEKALLSGTLESVIRDDEEEASWASRPGF
ncbi:MAG: glutamate synthase (NADPH/NADH) large chain [Myxococcota bacterium]